MTDKIYLSFNRLYCLKDGDYHGATLSFKIKHGDKVVAEGERVGKSLSTFISPIPIEEMEITEPLTIEYVCTGNVEDVSVSSVNPALGDKLLYLDGKVFIREAFISDAIITNAVANNINAHRRKIESVATVQSLPFGVEVSWKTTKTNTRVRIWRSKGSGHRELSISGLIPKSQTSYAVGGLRAGECIDIEVEFYGDDGNLLFCSPPIKASSSSDVSDYFTVTLNGIPQTGSAGMQLGINNGEKDKPDDLPEKLSSAISEQVRSSIKQELQAGGLISRALGR